MCGRRVRHRLRRASTRVENVDVRRSTSTPRRRASTPMSDASIHTRECGRPFAGGLPGAMLTGPPTHLRTRFGYDRQCPGVRSHASLSARITSLKATEIPGCMQIEHTAPLCQPRHSCVSGWWHLVESEHAAAGPSGVLMRHLRMTLPHPVSGERLGAHTGRPCSGVSEP